MQNFVNQFIQEFQTHQNRQKEEQEFLSKLFTEYPIYCILTFLIVNIISFYIKNLFSSIINRIENLNSTDLRTLFLFLLSISILSHSIDFSN